MGISYDVKQNAALGAAGGLSDLIFLRFPQRGLHKKGSAVLRAKPFYIVSYFISDETTLNISSSDRPWKLISKNTLLHENSA